jgi:hypothetical protein
MQEFLILKSKQRIFNFNFSEPSSPVSTTLSRKSISILKSKFTKTSHHFTPSGLNTSLENFAFKKRHERNVCLYLDDCLPPLER